jgi:hypothetical protein
MSYSDATSRYVQCTINLQHNWFLEGSYF